jgi:predicted RNA-binding protein YlxR (DUF448 family)
MGAKALEHGKAAGKPDDDGGPERTCALTRAKLAPDELIRFVRGPDGAIVPDLGSRLPGRGVWVSLSRSAVAEAARRNVFARSLKRQVTVATDLSARVEALLKARVTGALGFAVKAGQVTAGFTKVENAIDKGEAIALVHAADAAVDGRSKLDRKYRAMLAETVPGATPRIVTELTNEELSLAMGRSHVVHAALTKGGAAQNFLKEAGRLERYRSQGTGEAARPSASSADTEHA